MVLDGDGKILISRNIPHTPEAVMEMAGRLPEHTGYVVESSSVLGGTCRLMAEETKLGVALSNPRTALLIAKPKTDKVNAVVLADMHRGYCIAACHAVDTKTMGRRNIHHRCGLVRKRVQCKIPTHDVLLQLNFRTKAVRFLTHCIYRVRDLKSHRTIDQLAQIKVFDSIIKAADHVVREAVKDSKYANLIKTMPRLADFSALAVASMTGGMGRFNSPEALYLYVAVVPSVRSSANKTYYGPITMSTCLI